MKLILILLLPLAGTAAHAQVNRQLAATIDSLYRADQDVQLRLMEMFRRQAPADSIRAQDSLKSQTFIRNLEVVKRIYAQYGYPTAKLTGPEASHHFFVLVQHADHDPRYQAALLPVLSRLAKRGVIPRREYAYLYDRVQRNTGGKQLYGTQLSYGKDGGLFDNNNRIVYPPDLADPAKVDQRRKKMGMEPIEEYYESTLRLLGRPRVRTAAKEQ